MIGNIRRKEICELLKKQSAVTTIALSKRFGVSIETVRKDLLKLEKEGMLERVHGGAVPRSGVKQAESFEKRLERHIDEKREISSISARLVNNGDVIAIDTGSTAIEFIEALKERLDKLTIVTHSRDVFEAACDYKDFEVILCGGFYLRGENSFYGNFALDMLDNIRVGKAVIFPNSLSLNKGIFDGVVNLAQMQKKLISCANEVIIVADSSKFEKTSLIKVADMSTQYTYVTDSRLPEEVKEIYKSNDINIITSEEEIQ